MERAAAADLALDPHPAAHQLDQPQRDRQTEAGAAEPARRRAVGLRECLEDLVAACPAGMPMPVSVTAKCSVAPRRAHVSRRSHAQHDFALVGELDGVAQNVQQHLPEPSRRRRAASSGTSAAMWQASSSPFSRGPQRQQLRRVADRFAQIELGVLEIQPPRLDLREIEHVVDDRQQRLGRRLDRRRGTPAARSTASSAAPAPSCRGSRSAACGSRGSCSPGTRSWLPPLPRRATSRASSSLTSCASRAA